MQQPTPPFPPAVLDGPRSLAAERLVALSPDPLVVLGPDGRFRHVNAAAVEILGWPAEVLRTRALLDLVHPDDRAAMGEAWARAAEDPAAVETIECRVADADETWRWLAWRLAAGDEPGSLYAAARDTTAQRQGEAPGTAARLHESEQRHRSLFEHHPDAVFSLDLDGRFLGANPACVALTGYAAEELIGEPFAPLVVPEHQALAWSHFRDAVAGEASGVELTIHHRDGRRVDIDVMKIPIVVDGRVVGVFGIARDLTAQRALEDQYRRSERRFRAVIEQASERISIVDPQGVFLYANPAYLRSLGLTPESSAGRTPFANIHPEDVPEVRARFAALFAEPGAVDRMEYRIQRPNGGWRIVHTVGTNLVDDPAVGGVVVHSVDVTEERAALAALRTSEARYRLTFDQAGVGMALCGLDGRLERVNPALCAFLGYTESELVGMSYADVTHPDDLAIDAAQATQLAAGEIGQYSMEKRYLRKDGSAPWGLLTVSVLHDTTGAPLQVIAQVQDIAERRRAEDAIRASETQFRRLVERAPDGIVVVQDDGTILFANPAAARIFHAADASALVGMSIRALVDPDSTATLLDGVERLHASGASEASVTEDRLRRLDGSTFDAEVAAIALAYQSRPAVQVAIRDVSALRGAEAEVRRQALVFETMGDAVIVMDARAEIIDWNPGAERMYGYTKAEMLGRSPRVFHHPDLGDRMELAIREALANGRRWTGEIRFLAKDGREGIADVVVVNQYDAAGRAVARIGINRDVTSRKALEGQLRQSQKMEAVGRLAGGVAHDFNNLLTVINGNLEFARHGLAADHVVQGDLAQVAQAAERAQALVRQLLAFGRQQVLQPRRLDVNETVATVADMLRRVIGEDVALETHLAPVWPVHADPGQIEQVIMNLAVNARDAMPNGGTIRLRTAAVELDAAAAGARPGLAPGHYVSLVVEDTGTGIDAAALPRLFEPFFTTKAPGKGTGLGLATVHGIVEQSGGAIGVESTPGVVTRFTVLLPRRPEPAGASEPAPPAMTLPTGHETVLLVEDEAPVRAVVRRLLTRLGYTVREAATGREALQMVAECDEPIDLVLTDVVMPGQNGRVLAEQLAEQRPGLRVLFMSGYTDDEIVRRGLLQPGAALLAKPFTIEALATTVRTLLDAIR